MILRYYSILVLFIIINGHVFSENILVNKTTKDTIYAEFNESEPNRYEIFNLYNSKIELNGNTIYEKLLGSAYYTGNQDNEGAELKFIFRSNSSLPESFFIIPTGQILINTRLVVESLEDTIEKQKKEKREETNWSFDTSLSIGKAFAFFGNESYINYGINPGVLYKNAYRFRISPILLKKENILLHTSIGLSTILDFEDLGGFIYLGFFPYQKLDNDDKYIFSLGYGYHLPLFENKFFLELTAETDIVRKPINEYEDEFIVQYSDDFGIDLYFNIFASAGYKY